MPSVPCPSDAAPDDPRFAIRSMTPRDVDVALDWAATEGWNPGLDDARSFFAADSHGFLVGTWDGAPVGCISAVAWRCIRLHRPVYRVPGMARQGLRHAPVER